MRCEARPMGAFAVLLLKPTSFTVELVVLLVIVITS
jgi:hypothetical protein